MVARPSQGQATTEDASSISLYRCIWQRRLHGRQDRGFIGKRHIVLAGHSPSDGLGYFQRYVGVCLADLCSRCSGKADGAGDRYCNDRVGVGGPWVIASEIEQRCRTIPVAVPALDFGPEVDWVWSSCLASGHLELRIIVAGPVAPVYLYCEHAADPLRAPHQSAFHRSVADCIVDAAVVNWCGFTASSSQNGVISLSQLSPASIWW